ncbi:hypothetical protein L6452_36915 [Arctium lappa]|uniref:Uncharacterized protein n=1 Tax=Arctium lappa TaxID=4217 RepID=A0ACB8Y1F5_ARCLA|nr:hypothetical protein L6452_36915 [Arctium lappa]
MHNGLNEIQMIDQVTRSDEKTPPPLLFFSSRLKHKTHQSFRRSLNQYPVYFTKHLCIPFDFTKVCWIQDCKCINRLILFFKRNPSSIALWNLTFVSLLTYLQTLNSTLTFVEFIVRSSLVLILPSPHNRLEVVKFKFVFSLGLSNFGFWISRKSGNHALLLLLLLTLLRNRPSLLRSQIRFISEESWRKTRKWRGLGWKTTMKMFNG